MHPHDTVNEEKNNVDDVDYDKEQVSEDDKDEDYKTRAKMSKTGSNRL